MNKAQAHWVIHLASRKHIHKEKQHKHLSLIQVYASKLFCFSFSLFFLEFTVEWLVYLYMYVCNVWFGCHKKLLLIIYDCTTTTTVAEGHAVGDSAWTSWHTLTCSTEPGGPERTMSSISPFSSPAHRLLWGESVHWGEICSFFLLSIKWDFILRSILIALFSFCRLQHCEHYNYYNAVKQASFRWSHEWINEWIEPNQKRWGVNISRVSGGSAHVGCV